MQAQKSLDVPNVAQQNRIYVGAYCVLVLIMFHHEHSPKIRIQLYRTL